MPAQDPMAAQDSIDPAAPVDPRDARGPRRARWGRRRGRGPNGPADRDRRPRSRRAWLHLLIVIVIVIAVVVLVVLIYRWIQVPPLAPLPEPTAERTSGGAWPDVARGRYLVQAGDCMACHTADGGQPFAGGRAVPTPFGTIYSTNITPDPGTGLGKWRFEEFYRALHHGIRRDGSRLYPAFPYTAYTKVTREDALAIKAYLDTVAPVRQPATNNELPWPLSMRAGMAARTALFFESGIYKPDPEQSDEWNRGANLVEGLLRCSACHTPRNMLGAEKEGEAFSGGVAERAFAPSLRGGMHDGLGAWSVDEVVTYLKTGATTAAAGPMAEVIERSTQHLSGADFQAVAIYVKNLPGNDARGQDDGRAKSDSGNSGKVEQDRLDRGAAVYVDNCQACHMSGGAGQPDVFPRLKDSSAVMAAKPDTLINVLLQGGRIPATASKPTGLQMPAFDRKLSDAEVADVLTYIRNAWGNGAGAVSESSVTHKRKTMSRAP